MNFASKGDVSSFLHTRANARGIFKSTTGWITTDSGYRHRATTLFVGQSTIFMLTGEGATGEAYCLAHHVTVDGEKRRLMVASLRYLDTFVKTGEARLFAERLLYVDWVEERALS